MTFHDDLKRGVAIEMQVLASIRKKYPCATLIDGYKGYDIWIPETGTGVEVKYDPMSNETGNLVVEVEMSGNASALLATEAKWWVFYDGDVFLWVRPKDIIYCIIENKLVYVEFVGAGDRNKKKAFLIKKELLFKYGEKR